MAESTTNDNEFSGWMRVRIGKGEHSYRTCICRGQTVSEELKELRRAVDLRRSGSTEEARREEHE